MRARWMRRAPAAPMRIRPRAGLGDSKGSRAARAVFRPTTFSPNSSAISGARHRQEPPRSTPQRGQDTTYDVDVEFLDAIKGTSRRITLDWDKTLEVKIPPGVRDGQQIRLKSQGAAGKNGGARGDAFVKINVLPHPYFSRKGNDIYLDVPISVREALFGAKIKVPTVAGPVTMTVPQHANSGLVFRLKEKGVAYDGDKKRGDQYVKLIVMLPSKPDPDLEKLVKRWPESQDRDIRKSLDVD